MGLKEYNKKRDFKNTPEPSGVEDVAHLNRFVVQRHRASHLHYDLRLEMDGVLKSWAVPKGPSMNPEDKRLAVETEDHPIKYLSFEGKIPKGNYGAGTMNIWDNGTYLSKTDVFKDYKEGKLSISFSGKKLKGLFALVKTSYQGKQNQWLLIKKQDTYAVEELYDAETFAEDIQEKKTKLDLGKIPSLLNSSIKPMLASPAAEVFNNPNYIFELKYDGYRCIAHVQLGEVSLLSRNGINFNEKFQKIVESLKHLKHDVVLDGEVVIVNSKGIPQFQDLQKYPEIQTKGILQYMVFDLLYLNGHNIIELPLTDRKSLLKDLLIDNDICLYCDHIEGMGKTLFEQAIQIGMEGIIAKKADSIYQLGYRSEDWLKLKSTNTNEALICGYTISDKNNRAFGSLILGMMDDEHLVYVGNCGSGFSHKKLKSLLKQFEPLVIDDTPFEMVPNLKGRKPVWMKPVVLCEVEFAEWTKEHHMRHPVFKGLREDKEIPDEIPQKKVSKNATNIKFQSNGYVTDDNGLNINGINVSISNLEKIYWPESGLRKYDLIDYYIQIADMMLPYLINRPQNLNRHPNGIDQPSFYQKDHEHLPDWVNTIKLKSKSTDKNIDYLLCQNEATLLYMANLGCIEINPWHSTIDTLDFPDYTIIDLDPSPKNTFQQVLETARVTKSILDRAEIPSFCKTSGSSGLHIYIPLGANYNYKEGVNFTKLLCLYIQEKLPKLTTLE
ncbi:MAG: DNA ligase D, partial [Aquaticitalea sp.]